MVTVKHEIKELTNNDRIRQQVIELMENLFHKSVINGYEIKGKILTIQSNTESMDNIFSMGVTLGMSIACGLSVDLSKSFKN